MSKKRPARHGRARSLAVSAWPLRFKVALAVAIPLLLAATLGALNVRDDLTAAENSSASARQVTVLRPAVEYLTAAERATVAAQDASTANAADLTSAVDDLNAAADDLTATAATADLTTEQRYQVDALLDLSRAMREADTETLSPGTWIAQLRQLQSGVTQLITTIVNAQIDPEPRLELLAQTLGGRFSLAMQQALVATERTGPTGSLELFAELGVEGAAIDRLASAMGDSEPIIASLRTANAERSRTVRTGGDDLGGPGAYADYDSLTGSLMDGIDRQLVTNADDARQRALVSGGITAAALIAAIVLAFLIARMLLNPIRKVREGARTVAHEQLPEAVARIRAGADPGPIVPIDVTTHEEIGQLARAVDDMHRQAVVLAAGEARLRSQVSEMFITLSRRNTSLVNQQLGLIEKLEKDEEDPRRLESLFRLDHLAARMRRTADSLLILADAPSHAVAQADLTVATSLQAATAGVQDYQRVQVGSADTTRISDAAAADVIHLLTELVDNALAYSPPTTTVRVGSGSAPGGAIAVDIEDAGLGIPDEALAEFNETLRRGAEVTPDTARRMGLFVVSRLAQRHGITVSLRRNRHDGITATVLLPSAILDTGAAAASAGPRSAEPRVSQQSVPQPRATVTPEPSAASSEPLSLEDRINVAMGLPRRQPGAQAPVVNPEPVGLNGTAPAADSGPDVPVGAAEAAGLPALARRPVLRPVDDTESADATGSADTTADTTAADAEVPVSVDAEVGDRTPEVNGDAVHEQVPEPVAESPAATVEVAADEPPAQPRLALAPVPPAASDRAAHGSVFGPVDSEAEADTPIFRALRSAWLTANPSEEAWRSSEVEAGWDRADSVAAPQPEAPRTASGLPVRRPGTRLVPGGVSKPVKTTARDPEAIRARLAAHAAGVSRGRAAATAGADRTPSHDQPSEESPA